MHSILENGSYIAAIFAIPVMMIGWFIAGRITRIKAKINNTISNGDVSATTGSIAMGHHSQLNFVQSQEKTEDKKIIFENVFIYSKDVRAGDYWDIKSTHDYETIRITVKDIGSDVANQYDKFNSDNVTLHVDMRGALICGGERTIRTDVNVYKLYTRSDLFKAEANSLYSYSYSERHFYFTSIKTTHINPFEKKATIEVCTVKILKPNV